MGKSQVRVPWGEWVNSTADFDLKTTGSKQKSPLQRQENHQFHASQLKYKSSPITIIICSHKQPCNVKKDKQKEWQHATKPLSFSPGLKKSATSSVLDNSLEKSLMSRTQCN
jgi:hypothetical protein